MILLDSSMAASERKAVVRIESKSLTQRYGESPLKSGRYGDIFSALSFRLKLDESGRLQFAAELE